MDYILMCRSMTTAQKAVRLLERRGIYAVSAKAPQSANPAGCPYGARVAERNLRAAEEALRAAGIRFETVEVRHPGRNGGAG